jgi:hypothetical protein
MTDWQQASFGESEDKKTSSGKIINLEIIKHIQSFHISTYSTQANFDVISHKGPRSFSFIISD